MLFRHANWRRSWLPAAISGAVMIMSLATGVSVASVTYRADDFLAGGGLRKVSKSAVSAAIVKAASELEAGDALIMPEQEFGTVVMPGLPENVQLLGGTGDRVYLTGLAKGLVLFGADYEVDSRKYNARLAGKTFFVETSQDRSLADAESTFIVANIGAIKGTGSWKDVIGVWIRYNHEHQRTDIPSMWFNLNGTGQGCRILCAIEHNQGNERPACLVENANGFALAHGSTESTSSFDGRPIYELKNCTNVYLGHRRFYSGRGPYPKGSTVYNEQFFESCRLNETCWKNWHSISKYIQACRGQSYCWKGWPTRSMAVTGGEGNILDNIVDMGNPLMFAAELSDPKVQLWSICGEDSIVWPSTKTRVFGFSVVQNSMRPNSYSTDAGWVEPRNIAGETVMTYHVDGTAYDFTKAGTKLPDGVSLPSPPDYPICDMPKPPDLLYKQAAGFGAALLAAGADPTGRMPSDDAFSRVALERGVIEIPAGTFRLDRGVVCPPLVGRRFRIIGAGDDVTRIVGRGAGKFILSRADMALRKTEAGLSGAGAGTIMVTGQTFDGQGTTDYYKKSLAINEVYVNCTFQNYTTGAILSNTSEPEQYRFIGCKFINTGDYGVRLDTYSDKPLFFRCYFEGQKKGGLYCTRIVHFHGGVYQCTFKNIGGPGVKIGGGNMNVGYGPWVFAIDNCTFDECGNATEAAVDMGYSWEAVLSHSTIKTTGKGVYAGFKGNFAIIEDVSIDVNSDVGMFLGHQRYEATAGVGGSRLKNVSVAGAGKIVFLTREQQMSDEPGYPTTNNKFYTRPGTDMYGSHEWAFTHLLYNVNSSNVKESYALYKNGLKAVDLSSGTAGTRLPKSVRPAGLTGDVRAFDLAGRIVGNHTVGRSGTGHAGAGLLLVERTTGSGLVKRMVVGR